MRKVKIGTGLGLFSGFALPVFLASPAMATCSVSYSFSSGSPAVASQVNQDFSDVIGCIGSPSFSGNVTTTGGGFIASSSGGAGDFTTTGASNAIDLKITSTSASYIVFYYSGSYTGQVEPNGTTGVLYLTASDERLKNFQVPQRDYRSVIDKLQVRDFTWRKDGTPGFGVSAQQAYSLFPSAIHKPKKAGEIWEADYGMFAPLALWGVKDLYKTTAREDTQAAALSVAVTKLQKANDDQAALIRRLQTQVSALEKNAHIRTASN